MDRAGQERFGFSVWLGDEERIVPWTDKLASAPWNGTEWLAILHDAVKEKFGFPRAAKLDLVYEDKTGEEQKLIIGPTGIKRSAYWGSLSERTQNGTRCKNGRVDIKGVRGLPNLDFKVAFRGDKKLVSWPREKEVADSVANDADRPWKTIQNLTRQAFSLPYDTPLIMSVEDPDGDDVLIPDANMWNKFLSLLPLDKDSLRTIQIIALPLNEQSKLVPSRKAAPKAQPAPNSKDVIGFPVRKLGGKAVELPTKVLLRSGADTELGTFWITGSAAKGTDAERWLDSWNLVLQSAERLFGVPQSATRTLEIVDSARVAITLATPWCWRTFAELLAAAEKRMRHLEVDISGPAPNVKIIAPSTGVHAGAGVVSEFEVKHLKDAPVVFFGLEPLNGPGSRSVTHIAKWEKTSADESWDAEWARVHNHVKDLFALQEDAPYTLHYVDDDRDEIGLSMPEDWKNFLALVNKKKTVVRKVHVRLDPSYLVPQPDLTAPAWNPDTYFEGGFQRPFSEGVAFPPTSPDARSISSTALLQELSAESETLARDLADARRDVQAQRDARAQLAQTLAHATGSMTQQIQELTSQVVRLTAENTALHEKNEMLRAGMVC